MSYMLRELEERERQLEERIRLAEQHKKKIIDSVQEILQEHKQRKISQDEYNKKLREILGSRSGRDWEDYYGSYIKKCEHYLAECRKSIRKEKVKKVSVKVVPFFLIGLLLFVFFGYLFFVQKQILLAPPENVYIQTLDFVAGGNDIYTWTLENPGDLNSVKLSGEIEGKGEAKVFLLNVNTGQEFLILDSASLQSTNGVTGRITGAVVGKGSESNSTIGNETNGTVIGNETNFTEPIVGNDTILNETNGTLPAPDITPENDTIISNDTNGTMPDMVRSFSDICEETCDLSGFGLSEDSYELRVEITGDALLRLDFITYGILAEEVVVQPEPVEITIQVTATERGKRVFVSGPANAVNVPVSEDIPESWNIRAADSLRVHWVEDDSFVNFIARDIDNNGIIDSISWSVPHLSNQTFDIIVITKAEHLDINRAFISDIFPEVFALDGIWSKVIPSGDYVRVTFERNLTSDRDITLWPNVTNGNPVIEVYEKDGTNLIAEFTSLNDDTYNTVYLDNLVGEQDTFDLRVLGGGVEFEHIVDPAAPGDGLVVYADTLSNDVLWRYVDSAGVLGAENVLATGFVNNIGDMFLKSSPTDESEAVLLMSDGGPTTSEVRVVVFDNNAQSWHSNTLLTTLSPSANGGAANKGKQYPAYDVAYEQQSGDALAVYTDGTDILYATWENGVWTTGQVYATGVFAYSVRLDADPNSDKIILGYIDGAGNVKSSVWDGTVWGAEQNWGISDFVVGKQSLDIAVTWEGLSGDGMAIWVDSGGIPNYATYTGSTNTWNAPGTLPVPATFATGKGFFLMASGDRVGNHDRIGVTAESGNSKDLYGITWDGAAWEASWQDLSGAGQRLANGKPFDSDLEWETGGASDVLHILYSPKTGTGLRWQQWDSSVGWGTEQALPDTFGIANLKWTVDADKDKSSDKVRAIAGDGTTKADYYYWNREAGVWGSSVQIPTGATLAKGKQSAVAFFDGRNGAPAINVAWNQPTLSLGIVAGGSSFGSVAQFTATGIHNNVQITAVSGTGISFITPDITSIPSMGDAQVQDILFTCAPTNTQSAGVYNAVYNVNSNEDSAGSDITIDCTVTNDPPTDPVDIECNGVPGPGSCDITVNNAVDIEATGSTDPNGNAITYFIEALMDGTGNSPDLEPGVITLQGQGGVVSSKVSVVGTSSSTNNGGVQFTNPLSWVHTTGAGTDRILVVGASFEPKNGEVITSITYAGIPLTHIINADAINGNKVKTELWYLAEPLPASGTIEVIYSAGPRRAAAGAFTLAGVDQTTTISNENFATGNNNNPAVSVTSAVGDMVVDIASQERFTSQFNAGAGQTQQWGELVGNRLPSGSSTEPGAASVVMDWTTDTTGRVWAISAANIQAAPGGIVSSMDDVTAYTTYNDIGLAFNIINSIDVQVDVTLYDDTASVNQAGLGSLPPDLEIDAWDGTQFVNVGTFGFGFGTVPGSYVLTIDDVNDPARAIRDSWQAGTANQDIRIRGINMDHDGVVPDQIEYNNVFVNVNGKGWVELGSHAEGTPLNWDTSSLPDQQNINLRARAIDLTGSNTYSNYFTKNPAPPYLEIFHTVNNPPTIVSIDAIPNVDLAAGASTPVTFQFTAEDLDGNTNLDDTTAIASFSRIGETTRTDPLCVPVAEPTSNQRTYECTVTMEYFDSAGTWDVDVSVDDLGAPPLSAIGASTFQVNFLQEIILSPPTITFPTVSAGTGPYLAQADTVVTNNGNFEVPLDGPLRISAFDLVGVGTLETIPAVNFRAAISSEADVCNNGDSLSHGTEVPITNFILPRGPPGSNTGDIAYCLTFVPGGITPQYYSASLSNPNSAGPWTITILAVPLVIRRRKRKKKAKKLRELNDESILQVLEELIVRVKESQLKSEKEEIEIPVSIFRNKIGPAEALCKYLRENEEMTFSEIAKLINRDQRTVSLNYKNAVKKKKERMKFDEKKFIFVPLEVFSDRRFSILESLVLHFKRKGLTNLEIANLLGKDSKNIWTLYSRVKKKRGI